MPHRPPVNLAEHRAELMTMLRAVVAHPEARGRALEEEGLDPFAAYSVPEATISLKQGIGRLLRTARDRGVVAILDRRVVDRGYGRRILNALPLGLPVHRLEHVAAFFAKGVR